MAEPDRERKIKEARDKARAKAWRDWNAAAELAAADYEAIVGSALAVYIQATSSATALLERISRDVLNAEERIMSPAIAALDAAVSASNKIRADMLPPAQEAYKTAVSQASTDWSMTVDSAQALYTDQLGAARRLRDAELDKARHLD